jgi:hypothetical protein
MLLVALAIIFYFNYFNYSNPSSKSFEETFTTGLTNFNDPLMYLNSCKDLVKYKSIVNKLASHNGCDNSIMQDLILPNRFNINKKINCRDFIEKKIMLETEQRSWCDRISQVERDQITMTPVSAPGPTAVSAPGPTAVSAPVSAPGPAPVSAQNPEGPEYMQTQYSSIFGHLLPNESRNKSYVLFSNMSDPVSNIKYTSV